MIKKALAAAVAVAALGGCTTTPQGKSIDRANYTDIGSTVAALALGSNVAEANPLGLALIPLKLGMGYVVEKRYDDNCPARVVFAGTANSIFYGAAMNNLALAAGATGVLAPVVGLAAGIAYYNYKEQLEPTTFECLPPEGPLNDYFTAYAAGNTKAVMAAFAEDGINGEARGREAIGADHEALFQSSTERRLWYINDTRMVAEVDGVFSHYSYTLVTKDNEIVTLDYKEEEAYGL